MRERHLRSQLDAALRDTPVVLLNGPRRAGKTTLAQSVLSGRTDGRYFSLDDHAVLASASEDPIGFVSVSDGLLVIDEVQKAPTLFSAIKLRVDREKRAGMFLLTGSANVLMVPAISESLAGRMEILTLWPFTQGELGGMREGFLDAVFGDELPELAAETAAERISIEERVLRGGFPEAVERAKPQRRRAWIRSYLETVLLRDVRDMAEIERLDAMPKLVALLATRSGQLLNVSEVSRTLGLAHSTLDRYLRVLEATYLFQPVSAWSGNLGKRLIKARKSFLCDSALTAHLSGLTAARIPAERKVYGRVLEEFVAAELRRQITWREEQVLLAHFRSASGREVDLLLEDAAGRVVAVEVKARATLGREDLRNLQVVSETIGHRFHRGVILYSGDDMLPFGPRTHAMPVSALWRLGARPCR